MVIQLKHIIASSKDKEKIIVDKKINFVFVDRAKILYNWQWGRNENFILISAERTNFKRHHGAYN